MKILQLGKFYPIRGGVEKVMYDLTLGLSEQMVDCDMMCAAIEGATRVISLNGQAKLICCRTWKKVAATMISPSLITTLRKACKKYDIIHVHHPDPMACLALFLSGYKGKVVLHWHSDIQKQKILLKFYRPLQNWLLHRADLIVGTSPVYLTESPFLQKVQHKTFCLPIGIDEMSVRPEITEKIRNKYQGRKIVFSLGRLVPYKGYKYLVEAANYLSDDYIVLIGGSGPLRSELQAQIEEQGLQAKVELLGRIDEDDLPSYYEACTLFCLSSIQKTEAFGIVQIEAMAFGKPVVATNIPNSGVPWVNSHGISGLNVEPEDGKALADAIKEITNDKEIYTEYSNRAKEYFQNKFTKKEMIENCLIMYFNLWEQK